MKKIINIIKRISIILSMYIIINILIYTVIPPNISTILANILPNITNHFSNVLNISSANYIDSDLDINGVEEDVEIYDFLEEAEKYTGDFFEGIDINQIFVDAVAGQTDNQTIIFRILELILPDVLDSLRVVLSILVIVIIHSILKAISDSLENDGISKMIYYVQYILIITIIMGNFADIVKMVEDTVSNLVGFINLLVPLLITLMLYTGSITTSTIIEPIMLFLINFIGNAIQVVIIPLVLVYTTLVIISKLSDRVQIDSLSKFLKSGIVWFLGIILTVFTSVVSLQGSLGSTIDGITAKATKSVVSSSIPVVGKILGDVVDTVLGSGLILKNAVGFVGVILIIGISIMPIIKLGIISVSYSLLATIIEPIADSKITKLLSQIGDVFKILLGILCAIAFLLIIGTALVVKISNAGMMY